MRILLLGANGQVGFELARSVAPLGSLVIAVRGDCSAQSDRVSVDLNDLSALGTTLQRLRPEVILNAAAYTAVDQAEDDQDTAMRINAHAVEVLANHCDSTGALLVHYSTDYVFDGSKNIPSLETDTPNPVSIYGQTKAEGEQLITDSGCIHLLLRSSWIYSRRSGFVAKVLEWARTQEIMRVVDDQISGPTSARMLAEITALILAQGRDDVFRYLKQKGGLYHCAGDGACSRYEWAKAILDLDSHKEEQKVKALERAKSSEFLVPADRPMISVLNNDKLEHTFGLRLPSWQEGLRMVMEG